MITIRPEVEADIEAIRQINTVAFENAVEADLVDSLRGRGKLIISLVAEEDGVLAGHIAFSEVTIDTHPDLRGLGLGPMAVIPEKQLRGTGSKLVLQGLQQCRQLSYDYVVVLGHPKYYPRFGFRPASASGLRCEWEVPDDVFMVLELQRAVLQQAKGLVKYQPEFSEDSEP